MESTEQNIKSSFKWSTITEVVVKLISPVLNAILARILLPEAFAPLATITMVISFGEVFVESGFKKFLIQHDFDSHEEYNRACNVALWSNVILSIAIWLIIAVFSKHLAFFLGSPELWQAIILSGIILPLHSVAGILSGILQKDLKFQHLFVVRVITSLIPLIVTIPLALVGLDYWSLIIGNIASVLAQMIILLFISGYHPRLYFSIKLFKSMYLYGIWTMLDGIAIWLTSWIDTFIITKYMSDYYLGLYKNSVSTINALFSIVTAAIIPVLFVGLSKYQNNQEKFSSFFNNTQRRLAMVLIPLGVGVFLYKDLAVEILFGSSWTEAADIIGIVALTSSFRTVFVSICSDAYRAKAMFKIPLILQVSDICLLIPICILSAQQGFWHLVYARALSKLILIIPEFIVMKKCLGIDSWNQIRKIIPILIATFLMSCECKLLQLVSDKIVWSLGSIFIAVLSYLFVLMLFPTSREDIHLFFKRKRL